MSTIQERPFYSEFAWAYDLLIDRPIKKECTTIARWLVERGVLPGCRLLDAGCGTGRYSAELARRGFLVHGVDQSNEMIDLAKEACAGTSQSVTFTVADLAELAASASQAALCRGVLNDLLDDGQRFAVFQAFARALQRPGVLVADVREWTVTAARQAREPVFRKRVETEHGLLTFTSITELDEPRQLLRIGETHVLSTGGSEQTRHFDFAMRCWTRTELDMHLAASGFAEASYFGAYDLTVQPGETDRLVLVAQLANRTA